jgi:hypothetical protein
LLDSLKPAEYNFSAVRHTYTGSPNCELWIDPWHSVGKLKVPRVKYFEARILDLSSPASDTYTTFYCLRRLKYFFQGEEFPSP